MSMFMLAISSAMTRTPSFLGEENAMELIPNELLCYTFNYADNSTVSSLSAYLCEFYQPQEISSAREILWKECEQGLSTLTKKTRRSQAPTDAVSAKPFAEDIGVCINHVKNNTSASIMTTFCAVNIWKIPNCPPGEINLFSIVARLGALEKKLEDSEPTVHRVQTREDIAAPLAPVADDQLQTAVNEPPQKTSGVRPLVAQAECNILLVQETWLHDWELNKLIDDDAISILGVSGMDPQQLLVGRPHGGCAVLFHSSVYTNSCRMFPCVVNVIISIKFLIFNV
ncbi:hypothetical protein CAPTEDRAFT_212113 [Capitella teleta]|uniref:Uncharacterized protein n=1 Tax=Capitella teleta TaxID=283909 RepID=R7TMQ8_CAPTE|nr:hypothetical protein CAPTEDRAFT_212113 [Capitella teleta]|eukprot:ELT92831.1 hypothetical protein CAPTEDRAFT_212113 [Capitella teleta]